MHKSVVSSFFLLVMAMSLGACSATGKFKASGSVPQWRDIKPPPAEWGEPGTLRVQLFAPTLQEQEDFEDQLADGMIEAARKSGMNIGKRKDRSKKPQYDIVITENAEDGKFAPNAEAGVWGAVGGGVATGIATESIGGGLAGAAGGGLVSALAFGEKKDKYAFLVTCKQYTELDVTTKIEGVEDIGNATKAGMTDRDSGNQISQGENRSLMDRSYLDTKTNSIQMAKMFLVTVDGGSMSSKSTRDAAAREAVIKHLPKWIFPREVF